MAKAGNECKLYYNSATHASPTWVEIDEAGDVSLSEASLNTAAVGTRASSFKGVVFGLFEPFGLEFDYPYGNNTTVFDVLRAAFFAKTPYQFFMADGAAATSGTEGLRFFAAITSFPLAQPLEDVVKVDSFTLTHTYTEESCSRVEPDWYIVP